MELVRWEPFDGLSRLHSRVNDLFDNSFVPGWAHTNGAWLPPVDILESKEAYLIRAELPGMKKEDFKLELNDGTLSLSGERKYEKPAEGFEIHRSERASGKFTRSFYLPEKVKQEGIIASYRDGILEIHVPKAEEAKPRQITIN
ncbi:MAG: Hsp20/alpha crystallin family protein [Deltaproteobacteria bacterium]|nr:Hsp20/alpha crystallin family protein [Deltaproteobacteria bacterium]